jgi:two-component system, cell cycle sensor histidine kinase and response regulator CckA
VRQKALLLAGGALLILLGGIALSWQDWKIFRDAVAAARHARSILDLNDTVLSAMKDAETGERGFLLTGDMKYLQPYEQALVVLPGTFAQLQAATRDDPAQAERLQRLNPLVSKEFAELKQAIEIAETQGLPAGAALVGKQSMDQIREVCAEIKAAESAALTGRRDALELHGLRTRSATLLGGLALFLLLVIAGVVIGGAATQSERLIADLRASEKKTAEVRDLLQTTLTSIGDAVMVADVNGNVTFINPVAQGLVHYTQKQAAGVPVSEVFHIVNETTREVVESPVTRVLREGTVVGLANHTVLLARNGREIPIDDSGAPIRDQQGSVVGVVLVFRDISARKKAEEDSLRLASIVEFSGDAIVSQRLDGVLLSWNAAATRMFGYSESEMVGSKLSLLALEDNLDDPERVLERIGAGEPAVYYEAVRHRKDRSVVEIAAVASPIRDHAGNLIGVSRICRDVTGRRRTEKALERLNKQNADILESIRDGFVTIDKDSVFTYVNAEAERLLGKSRNELIGKVYWQEYSTAVGSMDRIRRCVAEQVVLNYEEFHPELGGWMEASLYPAADGGVSVYFRNVTERKQMLEALQKSEEQLRLSAEAAQIGTWNRDLATGYIQWSPQLEGIFGLAPGTHPRDMEQFLALIHPDDRGRMSQAAANAIGTNKDFDVEFRTTRPSGETRWMLSRGRPFYSGDQAVSFAGITMDITSRKLLEEKLRQSQKLESLGILAGGIAHDFNNLLVGILGNASVLLEETPRDSPLRDLVENLIQASERAAHLTRQMLAYSGKGRFVVERLDLALQVQQILALIDASIPKNVKVSLGFEPNLPAIEGDAGQMQQLIMNLVINGAEAIGPGGGTVTVSTTLREIGPDYVRDNLAGDSIPSGSYLVLEVHDTGIGMDADTQAKIFDPFFTTKFTGRGLGLAAVQGIVRGHHGALTVYSEPGKGTSFKVFLPAARIRERMVSISTPSSEFRGAGTILVVDDELMVQRTLKVALERYGYTVVSAEGGKEAIATLEQMQDGISLVLLDMTMPDMSGEDTFQALLAIRTDVPIIATSGYNEMEALRRFGDGLSGFIQKPYTPKKLAEKIGAVLQEKSSGSSA